MCCCVPPSAFSCGVKRWFETVSGTLIILTGLIYAYVSAEQGIKGNAGMCMAYAGYAFSNIGLYFLATK